MKALILLGLVCVLVLVLVGCVSPSKNPCLNCNVECPGADRTACVDGNKCECYYNEKDNNSGSYQRNNFDNNLDNNQSVSPSKNPCLNCNVECPGADRTACVDGNKCECYHNDNNQPNYDNGPTNFFETFPSCGDKMDFLEISPLKYGDFKSINPLGVLSPPSHVFPTDHIYLQIKRAYRNNVDIGTANVPLYVPGDGWITEISASEHLSENPPYIDYELVFYPCKELKFILGHITSLSPEILSELNGEKQCDEQEAGGKRLRWCSYKNLKLKVSSGQEIGTAGGNPGQNALDLFATDYRKTEDLEVANPDSWYNYESLKYAACPLDYFIKEEREKLYALLEDFDGHKRTTEPRCGTVEQDIKGTAQGVWFVKGTTNTYPESPHLALAPHAGGNPAINVFSVGTSIPNLIPNRYPFDLVLTGEVNLAFSKVKPGTAYCYESKHWDFTIVLELLNETTLKIEKQTSSKCTKPFRFTSGVLFER
ncbi:MAG: hypothetical protein Q7R70_06950 [Candidatus Diapherotrites archaeon]|nr:hypothetical protein [Candidatus Diapherotrites archaeon]